MNGYMLRALIAIVLLTGLTSAQLPPVTVQSQKPSLRRDQTQRTLAPRIIQNEDERTGTPELLEMINLPSGGVRRRARLRPELSSGPACAEFDRAAGKASDSEQSLEATGQEIALTAAKRAPAE